MVALHVKQALKPAELVDFSLTFGKGLHIMSKRLQFCDHPAVLVVANQPGRGDVDNGRYWHSDGAYLPEPDRTAFSVHHIVEPGRGGDTLYCDLARAYDKMGTRQKTILAGLRCVSQRTGHGHPILNRHPRSGRPMLYVNFEADAKVLDEKGNEHHLVTQWLPDYLSRMSYRHRWAPGDIVVTDAYRFAHCATPSDPAKLRLLYRTTVPGRAAWWHDQG